MKLQTPSPFKSFTKESAVSLAVALEFRVMNQWSTRSNNLPINVEYVYTATTGHQGQNIMNLQTSTSLESITTKGAVLRESSTWTPT